MDLRPKCSDRLPRPTAPIKIPHRLAAVTKPFCVGPISNWRAIRGRATPVMKTTKPSKNLPAAASIRIGDFSLQASSESEFLRDRLEAIFQEWRAPFASCIAAAQNAGEIDATFDPIDLAEFLLASWEGAILRMRVERGPAALDRFKKIVFHTVFKELK